MSQKGSGRPPRRPADTRAARPHLATRADRDPTATWAAATQVRLQLFDEHGTVIAGLDARERVVVAALHRLVPRTGT